MKKFLLILLLSACPVFAQEKKSDTVDPFAERTAEEKKWIADYEQAVKEIEIKYPQFLDDNSDFAIKLDERLLKARNENDPKLVDPRYIIVLADQINESLKLAKPTIPKSTVNFRLIELKGDEVLPELYNYKIIRLHADGVTVMTETAAKKIPIEQLSEDTKAKYGLSQAEADEFRASIRNQENAARAQQAARVQQASPQQSPYVERREPQFRSPTAEREVVTNSDVQVQQPAQPILDRGVRVKILRELKAANLISSIRASEALSDAQLLQLVEVMNKKRAEQNLQDLNNRIQDLENSLR